jgi:hypothetical protein
MKTTRTLLLAVAAALAFAGANGKAASTNSIPALTMSGTLELVKTNYTAKSGKNTIQATEKFSFNNSYIMEIISNALAQGYAIGIPPITVPPKSYIVYDPNGVDTNGLNPNNIDPNALNGIFYVTNENHFSCPLSGLDTVGDYYSYAEFDSDNGGTNGEVLGFDLGPYDGYNNLDDFNYVSSFNKSNITNTETQTTSSTAVFYIHDNPYSYDTADLWAWLFGYGNSAPNPSSPNPSCAFTNFENPLANYENSIEIQGILTTKSNTNAKGLSIVSGSFTGIGNALINGNQALILSGKVTVTGVVSQDSE